MERSCLHCAGPIPSSRRSDAKYCSRKCLSEDFYSANKERIKAKQKAKYEPKTLAPRKCVHCGAEFLPSKSNNTYCSKACIKLAWQSTHTEQTRRAKENKNAERHARAAERKAIHNAQVCAAEECATTRGDDPGFHADMCSMHYQRARRAKQRAEELGVRLCPQCGVDMSTARRNAKYCSLTCTQKANALRNAARIRIQRRFNQNNRRALKINNPGGIPFSLGDWLAVVEELDYTCTYCGIQSEDIQMDHIVPLRKGGPHALTNLTPACGACNPSKKNRLLLFEWAPRLLGGRPRYDRTQPRGSITNVFRSSAFRGPDGPLPEVLRLAEQNGELLRALLYTESWMSHRRTSD